MTTTTNGAPRAWLPQDVAELVVTPVGGVSIAGQAVTFRTGLTGNALRVPTVTADPSAEWVAEGAEIPLSEATLAEVDAPYRKVAGLSVVSSELASDTDPAAAQAIGDGLVRDIARKLDAAFFGSNTGKTTVQPAGLHDLAGTTNLAQVKDYANLDVFVAARFAAANQGAQLAAFVMNPAEAQAVALVKEGTASAKRLLEVGAEGQLTIDGVPVLVSPAVANGIVWGIPKDRVVIGVRSDATVESDTSPFFTSDRVAIRATMRVAFAYPHPAAVVKITRATA